MQIYHLATLKGTATKSLNVLLAGEDQNSRSHVANVDDEDDEETTDFLRIKIEL
jgi:hypothetical protein